jgi:SAM-dependent methyltransferase
VQPRRPVSNDVTATAANIETRPVRAVLSLRTAMNTAGYRPDDDWASNEYKTTTIALARTYGLTRLLEIGGGRHPLFTLEEAKANGFEMTINDISSVELENMKTPGFKTACFDIAGDVSAVKKESFDLIYSHMVFEHVADVEHAWKNVYELLAPGGVAVAYYPALYAMPFIINKLVPESLSSRLVQFLYREREQNDKPKFPAYYDYCYGIASRVEPMLRRVGFRDAAVLPFYGHHYYDRIPVARQIGALVTRLAKRSNFTPLAAYAYAIVRK